MGAKPDGAPHNDYPHVLFWDAALQQLRIFHDGVVFTVPAALRSFFITAKKRVWRFPDIDAFLFILVFIKALDHQVFVFCYEQF